MPTQTRIPVYQRHLDSISPFSGFLLHSKSLLCASLVLVVAFSLSSLRLQFQAVSAPPISQLLFNLKWPLLASTILIAFHVYLGRSCLRDEFLTLASDHLKIERVALNHSVSLSIVPKGDVLSIFIYEAFGFNEINFKLGMRLRSKKKFVFNPLHGDQLVTLSRLKDLRQRLLAWQTPTDQPETLNS